MYHFDFIHKLRKCNKGLWIDTNHAVCPSKRKDFLLHGLYCRDRYIMAVPHGVVPEYSIAEVDFNELIDRNKFNRIKTISDTGFATEEEKILCRGWRIIVNSLICMKDIDADRANKVFNTHFEYNRTQLPRTYIQKELD